MDMLDQVESRILRRYQGGTSGIPLHGDHWGGVGHLLRGFEYFIIGHLHSASCRPVGFLMVSEESRRAILRWEYDVRCHATLVSHVPRHHESQESAGITIPPRDDQARPLYPALRRIVRRCTSQSNQALLPIMTLFTDLI